jgi:ATP-dependent Lhr-like helicase
MLRHRFARVAQTGFMLLRNPEGRRRRVGGANWPERRLFEQVQARNANFVLLRQALAEIRASQCDADAAERYLRQLPDLAIHCRWLRQPSPFAVAWTQPGVGDTGQTQSPAEALMQLHAELTRGQGDAHAG